MTTRTPTIGLSFLLKLCLNCNFNSPIFKIFVNLNFHNNLQCLLLTNIPLFMQCLMRLLRFNVVAEHVPGKHLVIADALSRSPLTDGGDEHTDQEVQAYVESFCQSSPLWDWWTGVIPAALRSEVLKQLHEGHQGLTRCRVWARTSVWWPCINAEITKTVSTCKFCIENKPTQDVNCFSPHLYLGAPGSALLLICMS